MEPADVVLTPSFASFSRKLVMLSGRIIILGQPATAKFIEETDIVVS
jgi:hypothetical protein